MRKNFLKVTFLFKVQLPHLPIIGVNKGNVHVLKPTNFQLPWHLMSCLNKITRHVKETNYSAFNSKIASRFKIAFAAGILLALQERNEENSSDQRSILPIYQEEWLHLPYNRDHYHLTEWRKSSLFKAVPKVAFFILLEGQGLKWGKLWYEYKRGQGFQAVLCILTLLFVCISWNWSIFLSLVLTAFF